MSSIYQNFRSILDAKGDEARLEKAQGEKEKGNEFFRKGNFIKAIEHYGLAMELDSKDAVFPVNRAMAEIKLKRWVEAEQDCTLGLQLDPDHVKALWRRGIARREQRNFIEAEQDLKNALKLDPNNRAVKEELNKVLLALSQKKESDLGKNFPQVASNICISSTLNDITSGVGTIRRRLSIEEVDFDDDFDLDHEKDKNFEKVKEAISEATGMAPEVTKFIGIKDVSKIKDMMPKGTFQPQDTTNNIKIPSRKDSLFSIGSAEKLKPPRTSFQFESEWNKYLKNEEDLYNYLKVIEPSTFPAIFSEFFDSDYLSRIIIILRNIYLCRDTIDLIYETLYHLSRVTRFKMILMFLDQDDRQALGQLFQNMMNPQDTHNQKVKLEDIMLLATTYGVDIHE
ncbi:hypothetical protein G9A89_023218 [Geosiphon pyriformis]|nr:hypothetical protein G9A89_023218 [Geosiphon pyriformis]